MVYAENLQSSDEYRTLRAALNLETVTVCAPSPYSAVSGFDELIGEMGFDCALYGVRALRATTHALVTPDAPLAEFDVVKSAVGFDELDRWEEEHSCESGAFVPKGAALPVVTDNATYNKARRSRARPPAS